MIDLDALDVEYQSAFKSGAIWMPSADQWVALVAEISALREYRERTSGISLGCSYCDDGSLDERLDDLWRHIAAKWGVE